jgi:hypothetical protein
MSTETIIKVGGISKEFAIKKKGPHVAIGGGSSNIGGEDYIGGEDFIEGAGDGITRDIKGL